MKRFIFTIMPLRVRHVKRQRAIYPFITTNDHTKHWGIKHQRPFILLVLAAQPIAALARYNLPTAV